MVLLHALGLDNLRSVNMRTGELPEHTIYDAAMGGIIVGYRRAHRCPSA